MGVAPENVTELSPIEINADFVPAEVNDNDTL